MWKGILNNEVDAGIASTISGQAKEVEASPRGLMYPPAPASDKAGWARINKISPYYAPHKTTCVRHLAAEPGRAAELSLSDFHGICLAAGKPGVFPRQVDDRELRRLQGRRARRLAGLELKRQILSWALPYHEGAVKAFKESGVWTAEHEAHNQGLDQTPGHPGARGTRSSSPIRRTRSRPSSKADDAARAAALKDKLTWT